jgi:hypothetical protein
MKSNINEANVNKADVKAILQTAGETRNSSKRFLGLGRRKIDVADLQKAWAKGLEDDGSDAYSTDLDTIKRILLKAGFGKKEINKVFAKVLKTDNSDRYSDAADAPIRSEGVQKIADYIKKNGLQAEMIEFLKDQYSDEIGITEKVMFEDIREIFTAIVQEERSERVRLMKEDDRILLGRAKK